MGLFGWIFGSNSNSDFETVTVKGPLRPNSYEKNVEQKKVEKIAEMEAKGYELVSSTGRQVDYGSEGLIGSFLSGFRGDSTIIEYTLVFKKPGR